MRKLYYIIHIQHFTACQTLNGSNHEYKTVFNKYFLSDNEFSQNYYFIWFRLVCKNKNQKDQALCNLFSVNALRTLNSDPFRPQDTATATRRELEQLTRLRLAVQESTEDSSLYKPYYMVDLRPWSKPIAVETNFTWKDFARNWRYENAHIHQNLILFRIVWTNSDSRLNGYRYRGQWTFLIKTIFLLIIVDHIRR